MRRAQVPLTYSQGFTPHPKIALAAPLSLGVTSEAELMDVFLTRRMSPLAFTKTVGQQLPPGIEILEVQEIFLGLASLQSKMRASEYEVVVKNDRGLDEIHEAIDLLLQAETFPWKHMRDTGPRRYDLRKLVEDIWLIDARNGRCTLGMRLKTSPQGSGRAEQVTLALGFTEVPEAIHRTKLLLAIR